MSVIVSPSVSAARRSFFLLFAACLLLISSPLFAEELFDFTDFASFAEHWLQSGCTSANDWCGGSDYDISGTVDVKDLSLFSENWLASKEPVLSDDIAELIINLDIREKWKYAEAFMLRSLYEKWRRCLRPAYLKHIKDWLDYLVYPDGTIRDYSQSAYNLDMIQPGNLCLIMYRHFGTAKYNLAAEKLLVQLINQPTTFDGGFWHKQRYPYQMWLDGVYMAEPFASQYAKMFNAPQWFNEAGFQITLIATHTQDTQIYGDPTRTGLCYHGWDGSAFETPPKTPKPWADPVYGHSPEFWGRAMGWYSMALVDCLDYLPADHSYRLQIITILNDLFAALADYQDPATGMWWQIVDKGYPRATYPENYTESSCTAMFSYAIGKAVEKGYIASDPDYYLNVSRDGFEGLVANKIHFDPGWLVLIDTVEMGSLYYDGNYYTADYDYYMRVPRVDNDPKGVGALMFAALQYEKPVPSE